MPRRIRVAFCLDSFAIGGTELNAIRTAEALDANRVELSIYHLQTRGPLRSRYEQLGVRMKHVPIANLYSPRTAMQGMQLANQLRRDNVDVLHSHDIYCNIFAVPWARLLSSCAIVASRRWGRKASRPELARVNHWSCLFAHRILANSSGVAEMMAREEGVARGKIVEIPNFLTDIAFEVAMDEQRVARQRAWGVPDQTFVVGIIARLSPVKNHALLLEAMAQLGARFHLVVVGDGPCRRELEDHAHRLNVKSRIHFLGEIIATENLHQYFDASVLCSLSEGFPNSLIEAMAASRPVVATPVGGVTDVVTQGVTGILVPVDSAAPLADALRMLESDSPLRARLGAAGRDAVRTKFHREAVIEKLMALYRMLADLRQPATSSSP